MAKKTMCFDLDSSSIKIKEIMENKDFVKIEVWAISNIYPNNNQSHFPLHSMKTNVKNKNFYNKPILGKFNIFTNNYESHNAQQKYDSDLDIEYRDFSNGERPLGVIRESDNVKIVQDSDGLYWIVFTAVLWTKYNYSGVKKLLKSKRSKVSVEVTVSESHTDDNEIEIFDEWMFDGVTIIGYRPNTMIEAKEGINGAHLTILEKINQPVFSNQIKSIQFAYDELIENNGDIKENDSHLYINKNLEKEGLQFMTEVEKKTVIENTLATFVESKQSVLFVSCSENEVVFSLDGVMYKANYEFDDNDTFTLDFENKTLFEQDDNDDSDNEDNNDDNNDESTQCNNDCDDCGSGADNEDDTNNENHCGNSFEDNGSDNENSATENDFSDENSSSEEFDNDDSNNDDSNNDNSDNDDSDNDDSDNDDCSHENCSNEEDVDGNQCGRCFSNDENTVNIDNQKYTLTQLFEKYNNDTSELTRKFEEVNNQLILAQEKIKIFEDAEKQARIESLCSSVRAFAKNKGLSEENVEKFVENCKEGHYADFESAKKEIVYKIFVDNENNSNTEEKEFSVKTESVKKNKMNKKMPLKGIEALRQYVQE